MSGSTHDNADPPNPTALTEEQKIFLALAYDRLRTLAGHIFHCNFPDLRDQHDPTSILHSAIIRLGDVLTRLPPPTSEEELRRYRRLIARAIRHQLIDLTRYRSRRQNNTAPTDELPDQSGDEPLSLAAWSEFHTKVESLPEELAEVVELHHYLGYTQAEIAVQLGIHPKQVSHRWAKAKLLLGQWSPVEPPGAEDE